MQGIDIDVLRACQQWLRHGHGCELVTVLRTWGSSPRPEGALMAIRDDGVVAGSVSGGCIEDDLIHAMHAHGLVRSAPEIVRYGVTAEQAHRFGLPCGGTIELAIEPLRAQLTRWLDELLARLARQETVRRTVDLESGEVLLAPATREDMLQVAHGAFTSVHGPRWRLLLIGAGQLAQFLAQMAQALDYQLTVCDPREEHRHGWSLPGVAVLHAMPDDVVLEMRPDRRCAVVALTHDPKLDDLALMEALKSDAFYVAAIGSRVNNERRRERLLEFGLTEQDTARLHGPAGLYIGSKTPYEIAVSILAELTAVKNGVALPREMQAGHGKHLAQLALS